MTIEKRFTHKEDEILEDNKHFAYAHSGYNAQKIIERLNELYDKLDCHILLTDQERQKVRNFIKGLEKENEQLKQQLIEKERMLDVRDKIKMEAEEADKHLDEVLEQLRDACYITDNGAFARKNIVPTCLNCIYFYISFVDLRHFYEREAHPLSDEELAHLNCKILSYAAREERGFVPYNKAHDNEHYCRHHKYSSSEYQQELEKNIIHYKLRETGDGKKTTSRIL